MPVTAGNIQQTETAAVNYDGVVQVGAARNQGTGTLLYDGQAVLTAAHIIDGITASSDISVTLTVDGRRVEQTIANYIVHPDYDVPSNNYDLALLWLEEPAPAASNRHQLYRQDDEIGQLTKLIGYGATGTGLQGSVIEANNERQLVDNRIDTEAAALKTFLGRAMAWDPVQGEQLLIDFDNGQAANDALGALMGLTGLGLGDDEGLIARGDSGGPALINNQVAGVASYTASLSRGIIDPDIDAATNSTFGEIAGLQRVSSNQQWIDQQMRARYPDAPQTPDEVSEMIAEGDSGSTYAYFMLQFTGERDTPNQLLSVRYRTEDGTAEAGEDYIAAEGLLILYPDEQNAVIPVEVLGDRVIEGDELFSLTVYDPVGGSFGQGVTELTATRVITDDDGMIV